MFRRNIRHCRRRCSRGLGKIPTSRLRCDHLQALLTTITHTYQSSLVMDILINNFPPSAKLIVLYNSLPPSIVYGRSFHDLLLCIKDPNFLPHLFATILYGLAATWLRSAGSRFLREDLTHQVFPGDNVCQKGLCSLWKLLLLHFMFSNSVV